MKIPLLCITLALAGCSVRKGRVVDIDNSTPHVLIPARHTEEPKPVEPARTEAIEPGSRHPSPPSSGTPVVRTLETALQALRDGLQDAFFDYDRADLSAAALNALRHDAELLRAILEDFPALHFVVEGHCDDRGSAEYNLGLGDQRARRAIAVLREFGVPEKVLQIVSYGKEAPLCMEPTDSCRQRNRRVHLTTAPLE